MQTELKCLWDKCVTFHGHGCGGLAVGFRAVLYAWELFGSCLLYTSDAADE